MTKSTLFYRSVTIWSHLQNFLPFWIFFSGTYVPVFPHFSMPCILFSILYPKNVAVKLKKKKMCVSKLPPAFVFLCAFDSAKFRLSFFFSWNYYFFLNFYYQNLCCFWKNLSTRELKKRVKSCLISENTEVETFQSFLVLDVRGGKGQLK